MKTVLAALCLVAAGLAEGATPLLEARPVPRCTWVPEGPALQALHSAAAWDLLTASTEHGFAGLDWQRERLIVYSNGLRPTPGYAFTLVSRQYNARLARWTLQLAESTPPRDAVLPQHISHPCLVLRSARKGVRQLRIVDAQGKLLTHLNLR